MIIQRITVNNLKGMMVTEVISYVVHGASQQYDTIAPQEDLFSMFTLQFR